MVISSFVHWSDPERRQREADAAEVETPDERLAAAEARREAAKLRYRHAPRGEAIDRLKRLQEATEAALRASLGAAP